MERVLVTGAGGYIGTSLVPMLLAQGYKVRALDRFFFGRDLLPEHPQLELHPGPTAGGSSPPGSRASTTSSTWSRSPTTRAASCSRTPPTQINHESRVHCATLAKAAGVKRYVLPSSCSIYGFQDPGVICTESHQTNPLTTYAKANEMAEHGVLRLADAKFCVVVLRQATVYGYSPRMRFDLAINGMTYGAWKTGVLPLMRDGSQWRPMVHVRDTASAQIFMLKAPRAKVERPAVQRRLGRQQLPARAARRDDLRRCCPSRSRSTGTATRPPLLPGQLRQGRGARLEGEVHRARRRPRDLREAGGGRGRQDHRDDHARVV